MHVMARLRTDIDDQELIARAAQRSVEIVTARPYYVRARYQNEFIFGYSNLSERRIREGIRKLADVLN